MGLCASSVLSLAFDEPGAASPGTVSASSGTYVKVQMNGPVKLSKLKPGDVVEGTLSRDIYSSERELFHRGSRVRMPVDHLERRRRPSNDHWPWAIKVFTPRHEKYPIFKTATISSDAGDSSLQVSLISVNQKHEVQAHGKKKSGEPVGQNEYGAAEVKPDRGPKKAAAPTMVLEAFGLENTTSAASANHDQGQEAPLSQNPETLPAGTPCKILLLGDVSASRSKPGDTIQARLLEPVLLDAHVALPAGTLFTGKVVKKVPPRWLSRAGSLYLSFNQLTLPGGNSLPIAATLAGAELDRRSHTKIDAEGQLHGEGPGKAWIAVNLGATVGFAKVADDGIQLVIEAIVSTATDVSTAGTGRIVAACVSGVFMVTRHGRDVVIPRFTEMDISLDRPLSLSPAAGPANSMSTPGNE
jgi:hypothetical protein